MTRTPKLHVYQDVTGDWRWRLVAGNGRTVASGEGYRNRGDLLRTCRRYLADHDLVDAPGRHVPAPRQDVTMTKPRRPIAVVVDDGITPVRTFAGWIPAKRAARNVLANRPWVPWVMVTDRRSGRTTVLNRDTGEWTALPTSTEEVTT